MAEGDQKAFRFFFDKYYENLCKFVNIYLHDHAVSEEIIQDIFVYFWEKKGKLQLNSSVKSYLFQASKNRSLNYIRNDKRRKELDGKILNYSEKTENQDESFLDSTQLNLIIDASINNLPPRCREVFLFRKNENLTNNEIAQRMGTSLKTVENQMGLAMKKLKEELTPFYNKIFILILASLFQ